MAQPMSVFDRIQAQQQKATATAAQSEQDYKNALGQFTQYHQEYADGRRNPVADMIRKPERDQAAEKRYKQAASIGLIGDALGLIGKSYAASKGVMPSPTEGTATYRALGELQRLDDIYRQEGVRYDHNRLLDSLRRKESQDQVQQVNLREAGNQRAVAEARLQEANQRMEGYQNAQTKATQDQAKDNLEWQRTLHRDNLRYRRDVSLRNLSAGGGDGDRTPAGQIALTVRDDRTGKNVSILNSEYIELLEYAKSFDPSLSEKMNAAAWNPTLVKGVSDAAVMEMYREQQKPSFLRKGGTSAWSGVRDEHAKQAMDQIDSRIRANIGQLRTKDQLEDYVKHILSDKDYDPSNVREWIKHNQQYF